MFMVQRYEFIEEEVKEKKVNSIYIIISGY